MGRPCIVCNKNIKKDERKLKCPYCINPAHENHLIEWIITKETCPNCGKRLKISNQTEEGNITKNPPTSSNKIEFAVYNGELLAKEDWIVINKLEEILEEPIPLLDDFFFDDEAFGYTPLKGRVNGIYLNERRLEELPENIGDLKKLQFLFLDFNKLTTLPESFGNLQNLRQLSLQYNQLTALPETFGNLESLQKLDLKYNQLTTLPESFGNLKYLQELHLEKNQLTSLPESFGNLLCLRWLYLDVNQLTTLPESFGKLLNLDWISLFHNELKKLPENFENLKNLKRLNLEEKTFNDKNTNKIIQKLQEQGCTVFKM